MTRPALIGIAGPKRAGKDTLARGLAAPLGMKVDSFAAPLRRFVCELTSMTPDDLEARKESPIDWLDGVTPRHMMQTVGTEWGRNMVHGDLWVRALFARVPPEGVIVSDVRFPNEAAAIIERGGVVIQVSRPGLAQTDAHISERPLPRELVTFDVHNNGTPKDLVVAALRLLLKKENRPACPK